MKCQGKSWWGWGSVIPCLQRSKVQFPTLHTLNIETKSDEVKSNSIIFIEHLILPFMALLHFIEHLTYRSFKRHDLVGGVTTVKGEEADYLEFSFSAVAGCNFAADSADSRCVHCARIKPPGKKKTLHS